MDANVWLALAAEAHVHHSRAEAYWESEAASASAFCRLTQLAFLRHLTSKVIMGDQALSPPAAWKKLQEFLALPEVKCLAEPLGLDEQLGDFCNVGRTSPNLWTDAYLAAFARCAGLRLVTFDHGFSRFRALDLLILQPAR
ncbi:MAG: TA system VapC family ribonuclease toxin [Limisphaerales bacterium]